MQRIKQSHFSPLSGCTFLGLFDLNFLHICEFLAKKGIKSTASSWQDFFGHLKTSQKYCVILFVSYLFGGLFSLMKAFSASSFGGESLTSIN